MPYTNIIQSCWHKHLKNEVHSTPYFLNPAFLYNPHFVRKHRCLEALINLFKANSLNNVDYYVTMMNQIGVYREWKNHLLKFHVKKKTHKCFSVVSILDCILKSTNWDIDIQNVFYFILQISGGCITGFQYWNWKKLL